MDIGKLLLVLLFLLFFCGDVFAQDVFIVANRSVPMAEISKKDIKSIYLGKKKMWPNNMKIIFVKLDEGELNKEFFSTFVNKSEIMFTKFWDKKVFTGGGRAPRSFSRVRDLAQYVAGTKGAIGYVDSASYSDKLKILSVVN
jgi:ABC-type phosphate transport system substrate-binding protein